MSCRRKGSTGLCAMKHSAARHKMCCALEPCHEFTTPKVLDAHLKSVKHPWLQVHGSPQCEICSLYLPRRDTSSYQQPWSESRLHVLQRTTYQKDARSTMSMVLQECLRWCYGLRACVVGPVLPFEQFFLVGSLWSDDRGNSELYWT